MRDVVIVAAGRTAMGAFNGSLAKVSASDLGATVLKALLEKIDLDPSQVDEVILGQVLTAGAGQNPARQAVINAGLPKEVPALTINKVCGSGLKAVQMAAQAIRCGDAEVIIAGGQENMSQSPHVVPNSRNGQRMGDWKMVDSMIKDGLWDAFNDYHMGITTENIVDKYGFTREEQDTFASASQNKAEAAVTSGRFQDEIIPVVIPQRKGDPVVFDTDEQPRFGCTPEALAKLRPAFKKDGSVTAGNASTINDGAAAVILCSAEKAAELGLPVLARIKSHASSGVCPTIMGTGPITATQKTLEKAGWGIDELELVEANEAFAAQAMSVNKDLGWNTDIVNVNGGAIALGHPLGMSGARLALTAGISMGHMGAKRAICTMCIGVGQGIALMLEAV